MRARPPLVNLFQEDASLNDGQIPFQSVPEVGNVAFDQNQNPRTAAPCIELELFPKELIIKTCEIFLDVPCTSCREELL